MLNNIDYGTILVVLVALYFVIKYAVKNGINQSMLFSDEERQAKLHENFKKVNEYTKNIDKK